MEVHKNSQKTKVFIAEKRKFELPEEMWIEIFKNLDFSTRQLVCTLVSKYWKNMIRTNSRLSGELSLENIGWNPNLIVNEILKNWPALKILSVDEEDFE